MSVGMELGEDSAALGPPRVSAAVGTAGRQSDKSVLNFLSQLAQESCQRKGQALPGGSPSLFWG